MKRLITITAVLTLVLTGCNNDPISNFAYTPKNPIAGEQVVFTNLSVDAESFEWSFDDGTITVAYEPVHTFLQGGTYEVQLKAFGRRGQLDVSYATISVTSIDPTANFTVYTDLEEDGEIIPTETDVVYVGEQVEFYNTSMDAESYQWSFGDGYVSDLESPVYSFDEPGTYTITLTAYGLASEVDSYSKTIEVYEGINTTLRITVLDIDEDYFPLEDVSVILYESYDNWYDYIDPLPEVYTTPLGKCVYEGLNQQRYYVDAWRSDYNNSDLGVADAGWVETQVLVPGYINDFFAYVEYTGGKKSVTMEKRGTKRIDPSEAKKKKLESLKAGRITKYSKPR